MINQVNNKLNLFSAKVCKEIDKWIEKYPPDRKQSACMAALRIVQEYNKGWLTEELIDKVANYLNMTPIAVYEVATFYSMYELKPVGYHKICVCTNISCMLNGSDEVIQYLEKKLSVKIGCTTKDGLYTLKKVECLGACSGAPLFQIGKKYYENLTPKLIDSILERLSSNGK